MLRECPAVFLDLPGIGEAHLLDIRAVDVVNNGDVRTVLLALVFAAGHKFDGVLHNFLGFDAGCDVVISGPLGWSFRDNVLPGTEFIPKICMQFTPRQYFSFPDDTSVSSVWLDTPLRGRLAETNPLQTPSIVFANGLVRLKCMGRCSGESCVRLQNADLHTVLIDVPDRGPSLVVDMRNLEEWCVWCTVTRVAAVLRAGAKIVVNHPCMERNVRIAFAWTTVPWPFGELGKLHDLRKMRSFTTPYLSFPPDPSTWTGLVELE